MSNSLTVFDNLFMDMFDVADQISRNSFDHKKMYVDWDSNEDGYIIKAELPGVEEENIDINIENNIITIKAEYDEKNEDSLRSGKYKWSARINDVDTEKIKAKLKNGILTIELPKSEKAKPKKITINKK